MSVHAHHPSTVRRRLGALVVVLAVLLPACSWTAGAQYFIHWGPARDDVIIRQRTRWDLTLAWDLSYGNIDRFNADMGVYRCHANRSSKAATHCVMRLLNRQTEIAGLAKGAWKRATADDEPVRFDDFAGAFGRVKDSADN